MLLVVGAVLLYRYRVQVGRRRGGPFQRGRRPAGEPAGGGEEWGGVRGWPARAGRAPQCMIRKVAAMAGKFR